MAMVKCAECNIMVSNNALQCPHCGYSPKGNCIGCRYYEAEYSFSNGKCNAAKNDYVRKDKAVCPAVIKKFVYF